MALSYEPNKTPGDVYARMPVEWRPGTNKVVEELNKLQAALQSALRQNRSFNPAMIARLGNFHALLVGFVLDICNLYPTRLPTDSESLQYGYQRLGDLVRQVSSSQNLDCEVVSRRLLLIYHSFIVRHTSLAALYRQAAERCSVPIDEQLAAELPAV